MLIRNAWSSKWETQGQFPWFQCPNVPAFPTRHWHTVTGRISKMGCLDRTSFMLAQPPAASATGGDFDWGPAPVLFCIMVSSNLAAGRRLRVLRRRRLHLVVADQLRGLMQIRSDVGPSRHTLSVCHGLSQRGPGHPRTPAQTTNPAWLCVQLLTARTYLHHAAESRRLLATRSQSAFMLLLDSLALTLLRYVIKTPTLAMFRRTAIHLAPQLDNVLLRDAGLRASRPTTRQAKRRKGG